MNTRTRRGTRIPYALDESQIRWQAIRAQGPGGQNVNKVSNAAQLHFNVLRSSLPSEIKARLLASADAHITASGLIVIKAQTARSLEQNRAQALERLRALIDDAAIRPLVRRPTKPSLAAKRRRLEAKVKRGTVKALRNKVQD